MSIPGFEAEATIYRSRIAYQAAWASVEPAGSGFEGVTPMLGGNGGICNPFCELCESDINSRTGCSQDCTAKDCNEYTRPCTGCANACQGGQFCLGVCTNPLTDPKNCGTCGNACPPGVTCNNGVCGCLPGQALCNGRCTDLRTNPSNCGACGNACAAGQICEFGVCVPSNCPVFCSDWTSCEQQCGPWPPGLDNYQCWLDCLGPTIDCLTSTCG